MEQMKQSVLILIIVISLSGKNALSEPSPAPTPLVEENCAGVLYKAKRNDVPIYRESSSTSEVIGRIDVGERVCYLGEEGKFAILQWSGEQEQLKEESLSFARASDLRPVKVRRRYGSDGFFDRIRQFYYYIRSGGVPEYSPVLPAPRGPSPQGKGKKKDSK